MDLPTAAQHPPIPIHSRTCCVCGGDVDGTEWCTPGASHKQAHGRCIDWSSRPFPFDLLVPALARCRRAAPPSQKAEWLMLSRRYMLLRQRWPHVTYDDVVAAQLVRQEARAMARVIGDRKLMAAVG